MNVDVGRQHPTDTPEDWPQDKCDQRAPTQANRLGQADRTTEHHIPIHQKHQREKTPQKRTRHPKPPLHMPAKTKRLRDHDHDRQHGESIPRLKPPKREVSQDGQGVGDDPIPRNQIP